MKIQGIEVVDAPEELEITITQRDCQLGKKKSAHECAASRAICRAQQGEAAIVHFSRVYIRKGNKWYRYNVPAMLRSEIVAFDRGGNMEPGDYTLRPVAATIRLDAPRSQKRIGKRNGTKPQRGNRPKKPYHVVTGVRGRMIPDWE